MIVCLRGYYNQYLYESRHKCQVMCENKLIMKKIKYFLEKGMIVDCVTSQRFILRCVVVRIFFTKDLFENFVKL